MLITTNKTIYNYNIKLSKEAILFNVKEAQEKAIRHWFDVAMVDSSMMAAIDVAIELGFTDLATEMIADMQSELPIGGVEND